MHEDQPSCTRQEELVAETQRHLIRLAELAKQESEAISTRNEALILALDQAEPVSKVAAFRDQYGAGFTILMDSDNAVANTCSSAVNGHIPMKSFGMDLANAATSHHSSVAAAIPFCTPV